MVQAVLRRALNDAMGDEHIARNEITQVLAAAVEDTYRAIWLTTMGLGLRRGEVLALRWSRIDLEAGSVVIAAQLGRERGEVDEKSGRRRGRLVESSTKTAGSAATLALPAVVAAVLQEHRAEQRKQRLASRIWADDDLVFTTNIGTAIEPRNLNRSWHAVCERAGVRPLRIHDLWGARSRAWVADQR